MFGRRKPAPPAAPPERDEADLRVETMARAIAERESEDPLVGVKIGANELYIHCFEALRDERGVHAETLLAVLGALAGFACPAAAAEAMTRSGSTPTDHGITVVEGADGRTYWFGDPIDELLVEDDYSIWSLVAGQAHALGATDLPDLAALLGHVAGTVGGDEFAVARVPDEHRPVIGPVDAVRSLWPKARPTLLRYCATPRQWPLLMSLAVQEAQRAVGTGIEPGVAATIVMEYAAPVAKLAPGTIAA